MLPAAATIKPTHKAIQTYYQTLKSYADLNQTHETGVRTAFIRLLEDTAKQQSWTLVTEVGQKVEGRTIRPDATLYKSAVPRGYYEAKDTKDDLDTEIRKKTAKNYPLSNIIFEDTRQAVLYQNKHEVYRVTDLKDPSQLAHLLSTFYAYTEPVLDNYDQALAQFKEQVPRLAGGLVTLIETAHKTDKTFTATFDAFFELCKTALNPNISRAAVDEMLVQHLLTERLIRKIFDNPEFTKRNAIATEIEKVIASLVSHSFSREEFLKSLDTFYQAIEQAAHGLDFQQKQGLLNEVYERFFQGYSVKLADTHGIVYTPQPIVDFMCASVVEVLQTEFGKSLGDDDVVILDPATGTGNFIVNLLRRVPKRDLAATYQNRLFANEIMLLPYYIAALNIEHAYFDLTGQYESFEGLCFVDTLELAEGTQMSFSFMNEKNTERVERQKNAPITVIIGNPPYNAGQQNENDNNKNRVYNIINKRISETYVKDSKATLNNKVAHVKAKCKRG
ncbi:MAG: N-6 DNA methylase [Chloroflexota bacterium]